MDKNYNSSREKLLLPEYGRNVVSMVNELLLITDRDERNRQAQFVIEVMGNINPLLRDSNDHKHKLWDHLFIMSEFKLDIDSPYEKPSPDTLVVRPEKIVYKKKYISHKQYGHNIRQAINLLSENQTTAAQEELDTIAADIAVFMRQKSFEYNQEYPSNEVIISDFNRFSGGTIELEEDALSGSRVNIRRNNSTNNNQRNNQNGRSNHQSAQTQSRRTTKPSNGGGSKMMTRSNNSGTKQRMQRAKN